MIRSAIIRPLGQPPSLPLRLTSLVGALLILASGAVAQSSPNKANWKLANRFTNDYIRQYVYSTGLTPGWVNKTDRFWYSWKDSDGVKFWLVDPKSKKKEPLFDSAHMAALLSESAKKPYDTTNLPITTITFDEKNENLLKFTADGFRYEYDREKDTLKNLGKAPTRGQGPGGPPPGVQGGRRGGGQGFGPGGFRGGDFRNYSPDKKAYVYAMDHNLYYVQVLGGKDQPPLQLTRDGENDYSFGSRGESDDLRRQFQQRQEDDENQDDENGQQNQRQANQEKRVRANVTWTKDSKRFFVTRSDSRKVKDLFLVNSLAIPRPTLVTYKYAMPGDEFVTQQELFVFNPAKMNLKKLPVERYKDQRLFNIHWQDTTSDKLRFVRRDRLQRNLEFCEMDLNTDAIKVLLTESVENAYLETQSVRYLKPGGDFVWWSERSGWGHFYLYANDGTLKNAITSGPYRAERIVDVDEKNGTLWFQGEGREPGENPYYKHLYRVGLDGKNLTLLDSGDADHSSTLSTNKGFVVDVSSRVDAAPTAVLRDEHGKVILELEKTDLSRLAETGWKMPETFKVKAADGVTDIYGNMWKPFDFDPHKKYPIIANVYPGPQTESVSSTFSAYATNQRLAQLGFIVIQIGNRGGNPARSNAYHSYGYYNLRDYGLADKKAGIEQLAAKYPWVDIDKVGIFGHSGGGFMTAAALLQPPYNEFFKVGVSSSGNHDNNVYNQNWSEQHHGLKEVPVKADEGKSGEKPEDLDFDPAWIPTPLDFPFQGQGQDEKKDQGEKKEDAAKTKFDIKVPTNAELAANLKGNLLLVHGDMDNNVHYAGTIRLMDALIKAKKRFDFMLMPGQAHGYGPMQPYFTQLMMEYFSEHLLGDYYKTSSDMDIKD